MFVTKFIIVFILEVARSQYQDDILLIPGLTRPSPRVAFMTDDEVECVKDLKLASALNSGYRLSSSHMTPYVGGSAAVEVQYCRELLGKISPRQKRKVVTDPELKWTQFPIQYLVDGNFTDSQRSTIRDALDLWQNATCVTFEEVQEAGTAHVLQIQTGSECVSFIGRTRQRNPQPVFLGPTCFQAIGRVAMPFGHVLGLWQEHVRFDRDPAIIIYPNNATEDSRADLLMQIPESFMQTFGFPYDYASVMQFHGKIYSANNELTIETRDPLYQRTIGQKAELSFLDVKAINLLYCAAACQSAQLPSPCLNGGYQDPRNCSRCKCPDGFGGAACAGVATSQGEECGGTIVVSNQPQTISSPGYQGRGFYNELQECAWRITSSSGSALEAQFTDEFGVYCTADQVCNHWVEVRYKGQLNETGPRFCCGDIPSVTLTSENKDMVVIFKSNFPGTTQTQRRGFNLVVRQVANNDSACASSPCRNGGTCREGELLCVCPTGFRGIFCETRDEGPCASQPCLNDGACSVNQTTYRCQCPRAYTGANCETQLDACSSNPCQNGATCRVIALGTFGCTCAQGFTGDRCERNVSSSGPCSACSKTYKPGDTYRACQGEPQTTTCTVKEDYTTYTSFMIFFTRKVTKTRNVQRPCTQSTPVCCQGHVTFQQAGLDYCGVPGWSDWGACCDGCQVRKLYGVTTSRNCQVFTAIRTEQRKCPSDQDTCRNSGSSFWDWLFG